jgi:ubiquinone/menaquinone biosynthesis C-methylase UbiE
MKLLWQSINVTPKLANATVDEVRIEKPINLMQDPKAVFEELRRVLKKNGVVMMSFVLIESGHRPFSAWHYRKRCKKMGVKYSLEDIEHIIEEHGFVINRNSITEDHAQKQLHLELIRTENEILTQVGNL